MIKFSKKMLALIMSVLMIFSCMAVSASAEGETETTETIQIAAPECTLDKELKTITVKKPANVNHNDNFYAVEITVAPVEGVVASFDAEGNYLYSQLTLGTDYVITATLVDDVDDGVTVAGTASTTVKLLQAQDAPATPVPSAITSTSITIVAAAGCQYALKDADGKLIFDWTDSTGKDAIMFDDLDSETTYTVVAKKKATDTHYESAEASITVTTKKAGKTGTPALVLEDKTNNSITVKAEGDVEFRLDNGAWQASGEFKGLKADTQYNIYGRYTFDAATQDPSAISEALIVKTNAAANFEADEKKIAFTGENGAYANSEIEFTVTGDGPADMNKVVYGDTRIVPVSYKVVFGSDEIKAVTAWDTQKVKNTGSFTAEAYAEKVVTVKVVFEEQEYKGKNADGTANWKTSKSYEKSFDVEVGRVDSPMTKIIEFFEGILNFLLNTIPNFLAEALQSDVWGKLFEALGKLGAAIG